jgi:hypothetical protein
MLERELQSSAAIRHDAHDVGICGELAVNFGLATHPLHARADTQRCDFKD